MTLARQVVYLLRRELRGSMLWMALLVLLVAVAVMQTTGFASLGGEALPTATAVMLCLALASAVRVSIDSPTRSDSFWAVQPIDARALGVAKLLANLCLAALCGVALLVIMLKWGYPFASAIAASLMVVAAMTVWSLGSALIAAACGQRAVAWSAVGSLVIATLLYRERVTLTADLGSGWVILATLASLISGGVVLVSMYRHRPRRGAQRIGALVTGALLLVVSTLRPSNHSDKRTPSTADADSVHIRLATAGLLMCEGELLVLPLDITSPAWARVELTRPVVTLKLADGDSLSLVNADWMQSVGAWGALVPPALYSRAVDDEPTGDNRRVRRVDMGFLVPAGQRDRVCGRVTGVDLRVQQRAATGVELMRMPLVAGAMGEAPGVRLRVRDLSPGRGGPAISMEFASLVSAYTAPSIDIEGSDFSLLNQRTGTVVRLEYRDSEAIVRADDLHGLSRMSRTQRLAVERAGRPGQAAGMVTTEPTQLIVVAPVWRPRTERRVTGDVSRSLAIMQSSTTAHQ
jgi:hypothetical protein